MTDLPPDFIIRNADVVLTCAGPAPRRGPRQAVVTPIAGGAVASRDGRITWVGPTSDCDARFPPRHDVQEIDARGCTVVPGFVDPHTHVVFAGDRRRELEQRLAGASYADIAAAGGGIVATVQATRQADEASLAADTRARLDQMLACGTTTCEAKSGYGLTTESELKILRVIRRLNEQHPIDLVPTFLGAHEIPVEYRACRREYIDLVIHEMLPAVAREHLAQWCDVFCEQGVFSPDESLEILDAGRRFGLAPRIHADELAPSGGSIVAAEIGARSADHLVHVTRDAADGLAAAGVVATLLPLAALYLKLGRFAPARMLIEKEVAVALATDVNPGGGFSPSMPAAMALACFAMDMTFNEALIGATLNAAYALDRHDEIGSLEVGKRLDAVVIAGQPVDVLRIGAPTIRTVIKNGCVVGSQP